MVPLFLPGVFSSVFGDFYRTRTAATAGEAEMRNEANPIFGQLDKLSRMGPEL
jgi:hypothetical protein